MSNTNRQSGDICVDQYGQVLLILEVDHYDFKAMKTYDIAISLRPRFGHTVYATDPKSVIPIEQVLKLLADHGVDFTNRPEPELTEVEKLQRQLQAERAERENVLKRLAALEAKQ